ncbi:MAG: hypothetical protein C4332_03930 [Meiothermus sp.]
MWYSDYAMLVFAVTVPANAEGGVQGLRFRVTRAGAGETVMLAVIVDGPKSSAVAQPAPTS